MNLTVVGKGLVPKWTCAPVASLLIINGTVKINVQVCSLPQTVTSSYFYNRNSVYL